MGGCIRKVKQKCGRCSPKVVAQDRFDPTVCVWFCFNSTLSVLVTWFSWFSCLFDYSGYFH